MLKPARCLPVHYAEQVRCHQLSNTPLVKIFPFNPQFN